MTTAVHINQEEGSAGHGGNGFGISLSKYIVRIRFCERVGRVFHYDVASRV